MILKMLISIAANTIRHQIYVSFYVVLAVNAIVHIGEFVAFTQQLATYET